MPPATLLYENELRVQVCHPTPNPAVRGTGRGNHSLLATGAERLRPRHFEN